MALEFDPGEPTAVLVIDMQNDFVNPEGAIPAAGAPAIVPGIARLLALARSKGLPVIFTTEVHRSDLSDYRLTACFEPVCCVEGTPGAAIIDALQPQAGEYVIANKRKYDAFLGTDLDFLLRDLQVKNLIVAGVCTDICVISTVYHARCLDYKVCVVGDCVAGTTPERHAAAFKVMEHVFARIMNLDEAVDTFRLAG